MPKGDLRLPKALWPAGNPRLQRDLRADKRAVNSLLTNRGNSVEYRVTPGGIPPNKTIVRDTGDSVVDDGFQWIVVAQPPETLTAGAPIPSLAYKIIFGVGGARQEMIVGAQPGFSVAIPSNSIEVQAMVFGFNPLIAPVTYRFTVLLYRGQPSNPGSAHLSVPVAAGGPTTTPIPAFARTLGVMGDSVAPGVSGIFVAPSTLEIDCGLGPNIIYNDAAILNMFNTNSRIELPAGCTNIITNTAAGSSFSLDFGISP